MKKTRCWRAFLLLVQLAPTICAFKHWVVTENGRIQIKLDSPFDLRRPDDLLTLMDQESRLRTVLNLSQDLDLQLHTLQDKTAALTSSKESLDLADCRPPHNLLDGGVTLDFPEEELSSVDSEPDCTRFADGDSKFDVLEGVRFPEGLRFEWGGLPEGLPEVDGRAVELGLRGRPDFWGFYNLGLLYWAGRRDGVRAVECGRRALRFAPEQHLGIPLVNLGTLLLSCANSEDGAVLYRAAESPDFSLNLDNLGSLGKNADNNKAFVHLGQLVDKVHLFQHCHNNLEQYRDRLQDILSEYQSFNGKLLRLSDLQEKLRREMAPFEAENFVDYRSDQLGNHRCIHEESDSKLTITCYERKPDGQTFQNLKIPNFVEEKAPPPRPARNKIVVDEFHEGQSTPELLAPLYPPTGGSSSNLYFDGARWPIRDECLEWDLPLQEQENLNLPVFIPLENKGFQIDKMLSEYIGVPEGAEHALPWYPPLCEHPGLEDLGLHHPVLKLINAKPRPLPLHPSLRNHFLRYVNGGKADEAEIGQRIITAVNKKSGPSWVLAIMASMYWRVRANAKNALTCLDMPLDAVPKEFSDVILVSLGSIFQQLGLTERAHKFASLAFKVNYLEPSTNFLLALIHYQKDNPQLAIYYLKNVLRADPDYYGGEAERLLKLWACRSRMGANEREEKAMCGQREGFSGEGVICSANGEQCKTAAIQCFRADNAKDGGVRAIPSVVSGQRCEKEGPGAGSILSSLHSGGAESEPGEVQMKMLFGDEQAPSGGHNLGDFYVFVSTEDPVSDVMLHVYDKSGTYTMTWDHCKDLKHSDWLTIGARNFNVSPFLRPLPKALKEAIRPQCSDAVPPSSATLDHLTAMVLRRRLPHMPEEGLADWLGLVSGDPDSSVRDIGAKIGIALKENSTSWVLATAAAFYWRVVGNTEEAITCLRQALTYVPADMKDIPLVSLANVLHRVGFLLDALEVAYLALESKPNYVVYHFTAANIHASLGDFEKALSFYRSSLALDSNFEPSRNRLQAIYCTLLFDDSGSFRDH